MHIRPMPGVAPHTVVCGTPIWLSKTSNSSNYSWPMGSGSWSSWFYLLDKLPTLTTWHELIWWATTTKTA